MKSIWKYKNFWSPFDEKNLISLGEGSSPLIPSAWIGHQYDIPNLYFKLETVNPTGSYKDRFAAAAVSDLIAEGAPLCLATSSGNTGAALAAYCARAGLPCFLIIVDGAPEGKINQMKLYGARTMMVKGFGLEESVTEYVFRKLKEMGKSLHTKTQISAYAYSPRGMQGVESIAYEIAEEMSGKHLKVFSPAGGGGLTLAVSRGFLKWKDKYVTFHLPELYCVQPEGNDTIAGPLQEGLTEARSVRASTTQISGLQVPNIIDGNETLTVCRDLNGGGVTVSDEEVFRFQRELACREGIFCEPAGAVALAGAVRAKREGLLSKEDHVVCLVTGHGFKDPSSVQRMLVKEKDFFESIDDAEKYIYKYLKK